jgi:hypothetical protein
VRNSIARYFYQRSRNFANSVRLSFPPSIRVPIASTVYYNDIPVGTICCRLETKDSVTHLYLLTMGVLAVRHDCNFIPDSDS